MARRVIKVSTTDSIPEDRRAITRSEVAWIEGAADVEEAYRDLQKWARDNDYDAIVGFRLIAAPDVKTHHSVYVGTAITFTAYGTCIAYQAAL